MSGENLKGADGKRYKAGSSPRERGKRMALSMFDLVARLIPA